MPATAQPLQHTASLNLADLEVGDIIATSADTKNSRTIRWATSSRYSHAILYEGMGYCIEAVPGAGVRKVRLARAIGDASIAKVFRHKFATITDRQLAVNWAGLQAGKPYDVSGAARVGLQPGTRTRVLSYTTLGFLISVRDVSSARSSTEGHDASFFCSELIARSFQVAQIPIVDRPAHLAGPQEFVVSDKLELVGRLT